MSKKWNGAKLTIIAFPPKADNTFEMAGFLTCSSFTPSRSLGLRTVANEMKDIKELTAAGTVHDLHAIPFSSASGGYLFEHKERKIISISKVKMKQHCLKARVAGLF